MSERPNIIYFVCHDLGRHLACYGLPFENPRLSAFAEKGVIFDHAFCTSPACSPSRACAMTGQYAHVSNGMGLAHVGWPLADDVQTIVEYVSQAGYETAHVGLEHEWHPHSGRYDYEAAQHWDDWICENAVTDAITYLKTKKSDKPFYLNIGTQEVHTCRFSSDDIVEDCYGGRTPAEDSILPLYAHDDAAARKYMGGFQSAISYMDTQFGRLLDAIDESPYADNTIIIFTTDHGLCPPNINRGKGTLYEDGVGISLLMQLPKGMRSGYRVNELIPNIDFVPTLLEAAGIAIPERVNGRSFWPLLAGPIEESGESAESKKAYRRNQYIFTERNHHGEKESPDDTEYTDFLDPVRSVRSDRYHYIRWYDPALRPEQTPDHCKSNGAVRSNERLYDVRADAMECVDISQRSEYRHVLQDMSQRLDAWMEETNDWILQGKCPSPPEPCGWGENWPRIAERIPWAGVP